MDEFPTIIVAYGAIALLLVALYKFFIEPHYRAIRHREALTDIATLIGLLPIVSPSGDIAINRTAAAHLALFYRNNPAWVDEGFGMVFGRISDALRVAEVKLSGVRAWPDAPRHEINRYQDSVDGLRVEFATYQRCNALFFELVERAHNTVS